MDNYNFGPNVTWPFMETFFRLFHIFLILIIVKLWQLFSTGFNGIQRYSTVFNGIQRYSTTVLHGIRRLYCTVFDGIRRRYSTVFDGIRRHWDDSLMAKHVIYDIGTKILYEPSFDHNSTQKAPFSILKIPAKSAQRDLAFSPIKTGFKALFKN